MRRVQKDSLPEKTREENVSARGAGHISAPRCQNNRKRAVRFFLKILAALTAETKKRAGKASGPP